MKKTCLFILDKLYSLNCFGSILFELRMGRDASVERLTASPAMHASRVQTPLNVRGISEKYPCFSHINVTRRSR